MHRAGGVVDYLETGYVRQQRLKPVLRVPDFVRHQTPTPSGTRLYCPSSNATSASMPDATPNRPVSGNPAADEYTLISNDSVISEQAEEPGPVGFRVVVAKEGYTTLVHQQTVIINDCGFPDMRQVVREFRLVKGPPGEDDVFRKVSYPDGTTLPMARSLRPIKYHTATLLQDGKVLVAGGLHPVEVYDPATNAWTTQSGLLLGRRGHGAVLLEDGRVLIAGGQNEHSASIELIGPSGESLGPRYGMASTHDTNPLTLLKDGRVLFFGGVTRSTELYDPTNNEWSLSGDMSVMSKAHTATLLSDGRVLAAGGIDGVSDSINNSAELFDPAVGLWSLTGSMTEPRFGHTATLLEDGRVLVVGGTASLKVLGTSEIYDTTSGVWIPTANLNEARYDHTATLLLDGRVLVAGGSTIAGRQTREAEIYDPATDTWN